MLETLFNLFSTNKKLDINLDTIYWNLSSFDKQVIRSWNTLNKTFRLTNWDIVRIKSLINQFNHWKQVYLVFVRRRLELFAGHIIFDERKGTIVNYWVKTFKYIKTKCFLDTREIRHVFETIWEFCYMWHHLKKRRRICWRSIKNECNYKIRQLNLYIINL